MQTHYAFILGTVLCEVFGTACIQASQQFTRPLPSLGVVVGYAAAFWFLSMALKTLPLGIAYATWSGLGILLATSVGWVVFRQPVTPAALLGMACVVFGIAVMHLSRAGTEG
jgi:small multidrug resistance pump